MCLIWLEISSSSNIADFFNGRSITGGMNRKGKYIGIVAVLRKKQRGKYFLRKCLLPRSNNCTTEKKRSCSVLREPSWKTTKLTTLKLHSGRGLLTTQTAFRNVVVWVCVSFSLFRASQKKHFLFKTIQYGWILKDCIKVQGKRKKIVALCARPPQNVKLGTFILHSRAVTANKFMYKKSVVPVQSSCFANLNLFLFLQLSLTSSWSLLKFLLWQTCMLHTLLPWCSWRSLQPYHAQ